MIPEQCIGLGQSTMLAHAFNIIAAVNVFNVIWYIFETKFSSRDKLHEQYSATSIGDSSVLYNYIIGQGLPTIQ